VAQPIRLALSGGTVSPPIDATLAILGKSESLGRLSRALARWNSGLAAA
jgi:glutamyl-tRNA synthetase